RRSTSSSTCRLIASLVAPYPRSSGTSSQLPAFPDATALDGSVHPIAKITVAASTSDWLIGDGLCSSTLKPSSLRPFIALTDRSVCGLTPRYVARAFRPRSAAILLKYAVAITLFAAPCSHTNTTVGSLAAACGASSATIINIAAIIESPSSARLGVSGPRKSEFRLSDCRDAARLGTGGSDRPRRGTCARQLPSACVRRE